jgi:hypothetical protein
MPWQVSYDCGACVCNEENVNFDDHLAGLI